jgi:hypothetical protein
LAGKLLLGLFGGLVGAIGVLTLAVRFYSVYPEFRSSLTPLIFFPLDAVLPWMRGALKRRYIAVRLLALLLLCSLSALSLLAQPLIVLSLFVGLPLSLVALFERGRELKAPGELRETVRNRTVTT